MTKKNKTTKDAQILLATVNSVEKTQSKINNRQQFGIWAFTTFAHKNNRDEMLTTVHDLKKNIKQHFKYNYNLPELENHFNAINEYIEKNQLKIVAKTLIGAPVLAANIDFVFFEKVPCFLEIDIKN